MEEDQAGPIIPEPRHPALIHQPRLERRPAAVQRGPQARRLHRESVDAQPALVGIDLDPAQPPRIAHDPFLQLASGSVSVRRRPAAKMRLYIHLCRTASRLKTQYFKGVCCQSPYTVGARH